jgi:hypothetical protein
LQFSGGAELSQLDTVNNLGPTLTFTHLALHSHNFAAHADHCRHFDFCGEQRGREQRPSTLHCKAFVIDVRLDGQQGLCRRTLTMKIASSIKPAIAARLGITLLIVPIYFVIASALRLNAPGLSLIGSPIVIIGALLLAFALNALPILSINLHPDSPSVLNVSLSLRFWNLAVIITGSLVLFVLLSYAFIENFQVRPAS